MGAGKNKGSLSGGRFREKIKPKREYSNVDIIHLITHVYHQSVSVKETNHENKTTAKENSTY